MNVKATEAATSSPATTKLTRTSRRSPTRTAARVAFSGMPGGTPLFEVTQPEPEPSAWTLALEEKLPLRELQESLREESLFAVVDGKISGVFSFGQDLVLS